MYFDNNRLHTETKEHNRKRRKETGRVLQQNEANSGQANYSNNALDDDNDKTINSGEQIDDDYNETYPYDQPTSDNNDTTTDNDEHITDDHDSISSSNNSSTDSDDKKIPSPDTKTNEDVEKDNDTSDDEYGYYNTRDKRRWKEEE